MSGMRKVSKRATEAKTSAIQATRTIEQYLRTVKSIAAVQEAAMAQHQQAVNRGVLSRIIQNVAG